MCLLRKKVAEMADEHLLCRLLQEIRTKSGWIELSLRLTQAQARLCKSPSPDFLRKERMVQPKANSRLLKIHFSTFSSLICSDQESGQLKTMEMVTSLSVGSTS